MTTKQTKKPNLLFIMVDQQRYDCLGHSKKYPVKTENLDQLAAESVWFSNAFTSIPLCCPARQSFLNGRRNDAFGCLWNYDLGPQMKAMSPDEYSWPRDLQEVGYQSAYIGKWHVSPTHTPLDFGFDRYVSRDDYKEFTKHQYPNIHYSPSMFGEIDPLPLEHTQTHWLADQAISILDQFNEEDEPWHLRLDFAEPHFPCRPVERFAEMYDPKDIPKWHNFEETFEGKPMMQRKHLGYYKVDGFTWEDWSQHVAMYYGAVSQVDDAIGLVMKRLEELGIADDTIVVYTADHGDMCGAHRIMDKHYVMYDDIVKVSLMVRWPGHIQGGRSVDQLVCNILDLPPTLLNLLDLEVPDFFAGKSMVPLLQSDTKDTFRTEVVSTYNGQMFGLYTQRMIRTEKFKYVWNGTDMEELYDLQKDDGEMKNLAEEPSYSQIVSEMKLRLHEVLLAEGDKLMENFWMTMHFHDSWDAELRPVYPLSTD